MTASIGSVAAASASSHRNVKRQVETHAEFDGIDDDLITVLVTHDGITVRVGTREIGLDHADFARVVAEVEAWRRACDRAADPSIHAQREKP